MAKGPANMTKLKEIWLMSTRRKWILYLHEISRDQEKGAKNVRSAQVSKCLSGDVLAWLTFDHQVLYKPICWGLSKCLPVRSVWLMQSRLCERVKLTLEWDHFWDHLCHKLCHKLWNHLWESEVTLRVRPLLRPLMRPLVRPLVREWS